MGRALEGSKLPKCELQKGLKSGMITTIGKKTVQNNETTAVYENVAVCGSEYPMLEINRKAPHLKLSVFVLNFIYFML